MTNNTSEFRSFGTPAAVVSQVQEAVVGKADIIEQIMMAILAKGHILIEDIPGTGKTTMALAFSRAMGLKANRVQFTPDVLPADLTGFTIYQKETRKFVYQPGSVMCNLLLADEINRTSPKTQSALLEVMEERNVTIDGVTHSVGNPFIVIATENPAGSAGTQLLPESQLSPIPYLTVRSHLDVQKYKYVPYLSPDNQQIPSHPVPEAPAPAGQASPQFFRRTGSSALPSSAPA